MYNLFLCDFDYGTLTQIEDFFNTEKFETCIMINISQYFVARVILQLIRSHSSKFDHKRYGAPNATLQRIQLINELKKQEKKLRRAEKAAEKLRKQNKLKSPDEKIITKNVSIAKKKGSPYFM